MATVRSWLRAWCPSERWRPRSYFEPWMIGVEVPPWHYTAVAGMDLVRGADGLLAVLEDNLRTPSGLAYASAARTVVDRALPFPPPAERRSLSAVYDQLARALRAAAPEGDGDPHVVLLSDGPGNSAWYEHRVMARRLGIPLVTPDELDPSRGRLRAEVDGRSREVDVVYRRTDEDRLRDGHGSPHVGGRGAPGSLPLGPAGVLERVRQRRGGRQARARLRRGDGALLPARGAVDPVRAHLRPEPSGRQGQHPCPHRRDRAQAASGLRRPWNRRRPSRHRRRIWSWPLTGGVGAGDSGSSGDGDALPASHRGEGGWCPGMWTCARSTVCSGEHVEVAAGGLTRFGRRRGRTRREQLPKRGRQGTWVPS